MGLNSNNEKHEHQQTIWRRIIICSGVLYATRNCRNRELPSFDGKRPTASK